VSALARPTNYTAVDRNAEFADLAAEDAAKDDVTPGPKKPPVDYCPKCLRPLPNHKQGCTWTKPPRAVA
jgi:hypothetical protein